MYIGGASPLGSLPVALSSRALWLSCAARFAVRRTQSRRLAQRARRSGLDLVCACGAAFALSARRVAWVSIEAQLYGWLENRTECGFEVGSDQLATLGVDSVVICYLCLIAFLLGEGVSSVVSAKAPFWRPGIWLHTRFRLGAPEIVPRESYLCIWRAEGRFPRVSVVAPREGSELWLWIEGCCVTWGWGPVLAWVSMCSGERGSPVRLAFASAAAAFGERLQRGQHPRHVGERPGTVGEPMEGKMGRSFAGSGAGLGPH